MRALHPALQDRRQCKACGGWVERYIGISKDGHAYNVPTIVPPRFFGADLDWRDLYIEQRKFTTGYGERETEKTKTVEWAQVDFYCPTCDADLLGSMTKDAPRGEEPPARYWYEADAASDVRARFAQSRKALVERVKEPPAPCVMPPDRDSDDPDAWKPCPECQEAL